MGKYILLFVLSTVWCALLNHRHYGEIFEIKLQTRYVHEILNAQQEGIDCEYIVLMRTEEGEGFQECQSLNKFTELNYGLAIGQCSREL